MGYVRSDSGGDTSLQDARHLPLSQIIMHPLHDAANFMFLTVNVSESPIGASAS